MTEQEQMTSFWSAKREGWSAAWVDHYWNSEKDLQRDLVMMVFGKLQHWKSVCEIGAHCGPNLRRLAKGFGDIECVGLDINPDAVNLGNAALKADGVGHRVSLVQGSFPDSTLVWPDEGHDIVLTCFMMAYIHPDLLVAAITELQRLSARHVVMIEPNGTGQRQKHATHSYYMHDYSAALKSADQGRYWRYEIQPAVGEINSVAIWSRLS